MNIYVVFFETGTTSGFALAEAKRPVDADRKVGRFLAKEGHEEISITSVAQVGMGDPKNIALFYTDQDY